MGRPGTHLTDLSSGWGPSGRRFKSCLPDFPEGGLSGVGRASMSH